MRKAKNLMEYLQNINNRVWQVKTRNGKPSKKLLGMKCPSCKHYEPLNTTYKDWETDMDKHIESCVKNHIILVK